MTIEFGVLIAVLSLIIGYLGYLLNKEKNTKSEAKENANVAAALDYIRKGIDDIRIDIKATEKQVSSHGERITRVEESTKQAHKRLDNFEKEMSK